MGERTVAAEQVQSELKLNSMIAFSVMNKSPQVTWLL